MKLVILSGAPCSGKSSVAAAILRDRENYFYLSYDSLKWSFSQYYSGKYYKEIHVIMLAMLRALCGMKFNVVTEALHTESRQNLIDIGTEFGYDIVQVNLEADYEVLSKRLEQRIAKGATNMRGFTKEKFKTLYETYESEKDPQAITFRTDATTAEEISESVLKLL